MPALYTVRGEKKPFQNDKVKSKVGQLLHREHFNIDYFLYCGFLSLTLVYAEALSPKCVCRKSLIAAS